jgi:transcription elongation factor Elf1
MTINIYCPKCGEDRQIECIPTKKANEGGGNYFCNVCAYQWSTDAHELR